LSSAAIDLTWAMNGLEIVLGGVRRKAGTSLLTGCTSDASCSFLAMKAGTGRLNDWLTALFF
jgi:hypothetical protein